MVCLRRQYHFTRISSYILDYLISYSKCTKARFFAAMIVWNRNTLIVKKVMKFFPFSRWLMWDFLIRKCPNRQIWCKLHNLETFYTGLFGKYQYCQIDFTKKVILFKNSWGKNQFKSHLIQLRNIMTFTIRDKKEPWLFKIIMIWITIYGFAIE